MSGMTLSPSSLPCTGYPDKARCGVSVYRDHRHEAVDDVEEAVRAARCSYFVLDRGGNLDYIIAQPDPTRGALREASHGVGAGTVLSAGHAAGARRPLAALRWSKS